MKKFFVLSIIACFVLQGIAFSETIVCGIGANLVKDPYNKKVFVFKTFTNSTALQYQLPNGAEIISVNDKKTKKLNINEVTNLIRGEEGSIVKLIVKYNGQESIYNIPRGNFTIPEKKQDRFEIHWKQVAPANIRIEPIPQNMLKSMSKKWYNEVVPVTRYWLNRKAEFKNGYDACMSYPESEQNACLINLTNREINKTANDEQLEVQQKIAKQQAIQNSINNFNQIQINNNLRNINNNMGNINSKLWY